jgi:hypothetical protein
VREIVGFVMGAATGAAGALFVSSPEGRALLERLRDEARPEVDRAAIEWEPVLREVGRAVRLAARELETATADLRSRIGEIAAALPDETAGDVGDKAIADRDAAPEVAAVDRAATVAAEVTVQEPSAPELMTPEPPVDGAAAGPPPAGAPRVDDTTTGA